jgi:YedE family putative selenium metabolism protein
LLDFLVKSKWIILGGLVFGSLGALAVNWGNPNNMGICVACFLRDIAGALKLQANAAVQYMRPEIFGFALGAFGTSLAFRESVLSWPCVSWSGHWFSWVVPSACCCGSAAAT